MAQEHGPERGKRLIVVTTFYPLVVEALSNETVVTFDGSRLIETIAGIAAAASGQCDVAERHFQAALRLADEMPFTIEQAEARHWYARLLVDRRAPVTIGLHEDGRDPGSGPDGPTASSSSSTSAITLPSPRS